MFSALKYFKSQSKNLYIIENLYYKDAEPKVTINIIIKRKENFLNIFEGGLGQKMRNRAVVARFWACCVKPQRGRRWRGGGMVVLSL